MKRITEYRVGQPFPGAYPQQEGCIMEMGENGSLFVFIQFPGLTRHEKQAFKKSFKQYAYFGSETPVPIAMWIFGFPKPFGSINVNYNARLKPDPARVFIDTEANMINFFLLDGPILQGIKMVGLEWDAVDRFKSTLQKQLDTEYSMDEYARYLSGLLQYSDDEIMQMGTLYKKKLKK